MAHFLNDIEEFTIEELRAEIRRRETAAREHRCWYCGRNIGAHTCKFAKESVCPGWEVAPPRFVRTDDCMAREHEYWQVDAKHTVLGQSRTGIGDTAQAATHACITKIAELEKSWSRS